MRRAICVGVLSLVSLTGFAGDDAFDRAGDVFYAGVAKGISKDLCKPSVFPADAKGAVRDALGAIDQADLRDPAGATPMAYAVAIDDVASLERFSKLGYAADQRLQHDGSLLHLAAGFGATNAITWLLAHGVPVDVRDSDGATPLMSAAAQNDLATVRQLLGAGADAKTMTTSGRSALTFGMACHDPDMLATLRKAGAPVDENVRALATKYGVKLD